MDKGKLLEEALAWKPTSDNRTRPENLWQRLMEEPWTKEVEDDDSNSKEI